MTPGLLMLLDALVRSTALLVAGLAAVVLLRRRSSALRHWLLAASIAAAALAAPLAWVLPEWSIATVKTPEVFTLDATPSPAPAVPPETAGVAPAAPARPLPLGLLWLLGVAAGGAAFLLQIVRLARISRRAQPISDERWLRTVEEVRGRYGIRHSIPVLQTRSRDLLATLGLIRPRILVPAGATRWTDERIRVVVCHELAHVRRRDWAIQIAADIVRRVYWFQPLMWIACRQLRRESEHACDDVVLGTGVAAEAYAGHLLQLARAGRSDYGWAPAVPMARPSTLERRIAAMFNSARNRRALSQRALIVSSILLVAATVTAAALHSEQQARVGQLVGTIYDGSGGVLPGVDVTLSGAQNTKSQATTDASGRFTFPNTAPGKYAIEASMRGFKPLRHEFELKDSDDWDRVITLQVGQLSETVTVVAKREPATQARPGVPASRPIRVGGNIKAPMKVQNVNPVFPPSMRAAGRSGVVPLDAVIGTDGSVVFVRVLSANVHPDFGDAAIEAVRQWKFTPTLLNGKPVEVVMNVLVNFALEQ